MPGFYYYLPGMTPERLQQGEQLDREVLRHVGLDEVLADVTHVPKHASVSQIRGDNGPDKKSGTLLAIVGRHAGAPEVVVYRPDLHPWHWKPVGDGSRLWIGVLKNALPMPSDLERWEQVGGTELVDEHGRVWRIPIARSPYPEHPYGSLPQSFTFNDAGEPVGVVQPKWQWLWKLAGEVREWYYHSDREGTFQHPFSWLVKQASRILGVNYRVGPQELALLHELGQGVLTQQYVQTICQVVIHGDIYDEAKKKSRPGEKESPSPPPAESSSSSTPGGETPAASPGIAPVGEG